MMENTTLKKFDIHGRGLPQEIIDAVEKAPPFGTSEYQAWADALFEQERKTLPSWTLDESLRAMERERAGYNGLGELWGCTPVTNS
jgi:hypothetical protein